MNQQSNYVVVPSSALSGLGSCCSSCSSGGPCASGDMGGDIKAMIFVPLVLGAALYFFIVKK